MAVHEEAYKIQRSPRIFINNVDTYAPKNIGKFLAASYVDLSPDAEEHDEQHEEELLDSPGRRRAKHAKYEIVGTVRDKPDKKSSTYILEEYHELDRNELLKRLLECDVIIYDICQHADQIEEASWAATALHEQMNKFYKPKTFILVSTLMTWAMSKPVDPENTAIPFTDMDYRKRKPHPNFKQHIAAEKVVVKLGKTDRAQFCTFVVASGLQYGMGENAFHYFFKASWLGETDKIPIFGTGSNILPTIHINDLASIILNLIVQKPKQNYIVAVDDSKNSLEDIVKTISHTLGPAKTTMVPVEEAFFVKELTQTDIDLLLVNLRFEALFVKVNLGMNWLCEQGLAENINLVVDEYRHTRGLLPIRICVLGPPAVGKSTISQKICAHYKLPHVRLRDAITEKLAYLESVVQAGMEAEDSDEVDTAAQELLDSLKDSMDQNGGRLDDQYVIQIIRDKLKSTSCQNQGYVLDGFPKTYDQAKELFFAEEEDDGESKSIKKILPDVVFSLEAPDVFLKERVLNLPESEVEGSNYSQERFPRRLSNFRDNNMEDDAVLNYFDELDMQPEHIDISSSDDIEYLLAMEKVVRKVGKPQNYGPTSEEVQEAERRSMEARLQKEAQETAEKERLEAEEAAQREARWEEWSRRLEEVKREENEQLELKSVPMRSYLAQQVMPTLTQGLIQCCSHRPDDPIDFLAEYLFKNNPIIQ
ncbi:adenylate kinase 7 [Engraulis encrasicolus]|uniref:adenylate kinase 7 n=1 Tax=Engraulis encrasicolus TaxID=184585 RepID=UPI002FD077D9